MKPYPIQDGPTVPWSYMAPHEAQARNNHGQTLAGLAERGGLATYEAELIVSGQPLFPERGKPSYNFAELKRRWFERAERVNREYAGGEVARLRALADAVNDFLKYSGATATYPHDRIWALLKEQGQRCRNQDDRDYWRFVFEKLLAVTQAAAAIPAEGA